MTRIPRWFVRTARRPQDTLGGLGHPSAGRSGMIAFLLFPAYLVGFSYRTIGGHLGIHYAVDVLTFCAGFYLVGLLILSVRNSLVRGVLMCLASAFVIAFHWANL